MTAITAQIKAHLSMMVSSLGLCGDTVSPLCRDRPAMGRDVPRRAGRIEGFGKRMCLRERFFLFAE